MYPLRARAKISPQNWRTDLGQIWVGRLSKTTGIAPPSKAPVIFARALRERSRVLGDAALLAILLRTRRQGKNIIDLVGEMIVKSPL